MESAEKPACAPPGVKLIRHNAGGISRDDDPSLPYRLELIMRAPEFMIVAFVCLVGGTEDVVARANTVEELEAWMRFHGLDDHPRLSRYRILGPDGAIAKHHRWESF